MPRLLPICCGGNSRCSETTMGRFRLPHAPRLCPAHLRHSTADSRNSTRSLRSQRRTRITNLVVRSSCPSLFRLKPSRFPISGLRGVSLCISVTCALSAFCCRLDSLSRRLRLHPISPSRGHPAYSLRISGALPWLFPREPVDPAKASSSVRGTLILNGSSRCATPIRKSSGLGGGLTPRTA